MNTFSITKLLVLSGALILAGSSASIAMADEDGVTSAVETTRSMVEESKQTQIDAKRKEILEEATVAIEETKRALKLLTRVIGPRLLEPWRRLPESWKLFWLVIRSFHLPQLP